MRCTDSVQLHEEEMKTASWEHGKKKNLWIYFVRTQNDEEKKHKTDRNWKNENYDLKNFFLNDINHRRDFSFWFWQNDNRIAI